MSFHVAIDLIERI